MFERDGTGALTYNAFIDAAVNTTVTVQSKLVNGADRTVGGGIMFLQLEEKCLVTDNYKCDVIPNRATVLNGTQYIQLTDLNNGQYQVEFNVIRKGEVTASIVLMEKGGFYGEYFNNAFLQGVPALTRVDNYLDFNWGTGLITNEAADFVSVQWFGKIKPPVTETFVFIVNADDGLRITIDGLLMVDRWDSCCDEVQFEMDLDNNTFYDFLIEYRELQESANFKLEWVSLNTPREVIPPTNVFYPQRVTGNVFQVTVNPGPSMAANCTADGI